MYRISLSVIVAAAVLVLYQLVGDAEQPVADPVRPSALRAAKKAAVVNPIEPLLVISDDCDLDGNGKVDEGDLNAADGATPAFELFRNRIVKEVCDSAERRGNKLFRGDRPEYDKLARGIIALFVPDPRPAPPGVHKKQGRYRVLTFWDASAQCTIGSEVVDDSLFEQIERGEVFYELHHETERWRRVVQPVKPVIIRMKPERPKNGHKG